MDQKPISKCFPEVTHLKVSKAVTHGQFPKLQTPNVDVDYCLRILNLTRLKQLVVSNTFWLDARASGSACFVSKSGKPKESNVQHMTASGHFKFLRSGTRFLKMSDLVSLLCVPNVNELIFSFLNFKFVLRLRNVCQELNNEIPNQIQEVDISKHWPSTKFLKARKLIYRHSTAVCVTKAQFPALQSIECWGCDELQIEPSVSRLHLGHTKQWSVHNWQAVTHLQCNTGLEQVFAQSCLPHLVSLQSEETHTYLSKMEQVTPSLTRLAVYGNNVVTPKLPLEHLEVRDNNRSLTILQNETLKHLGVYTLLRQFVCGTPKFSELQHLTVFCTIPWDQYEFPNLKTLDYRSDLQLEVLNLDRCPKLVSVEAKSVCLVAKHHACLKKIETCHGELQLEDLPALTHLHIWLDFLNSSKTCVDDRCFETLESLELEVAHTKERWPLPTQCLPLLKKATKLRRLKLSLYDMRELQKHYPEVRQILEHVVERSLEEICIFDRWGHLVTVDSVRQWLTKNA